MGSPTGLQAKRVPSRFREMIIEVQKGEVTAQSRMPS